MTKNFIGSQVAGKLNLKLSAHEQKGKFQTHE